jgi:hypothetical protein
VRVEESPAFCGERAGRPRERMDGGCDDRLQAFGADLWSSSVVPFRNRPEGEWLANRLIESLHAAKIPLCRSMVACSLSKRTAGVRLWGFQVLDGQFDEEGN